MVSHCKNAFLLGMTTLILGLTAPAAVAKLPTAVMQATTIARIEHIIINGAERMEAETEAWVTRASNREVQPAKAGMLLQANDLVATDSNTKLIIHCLNASSENDSKVILQPGSQIKIVNNNSYFVIFGRAWFGVKGLFSVRTFYWILGARGTEFEVQADKLSNTNLAVLDGAVAVSETDENKTREPRHPATAPLDVKALEEISLTGPRIQAMRAKPLIEERVRAILDSTNEAILASQPDYPARRVSPHFESPSQRSRAFESARFDAIWSRKPAAFDILGNVYSDWGEGAKALEAYNRELSLNPLVHDNVALLTNIGESFRLIGELDKAEPFVREALQRNPSWAPALNALGNIYFAYAEVARSNKDTNSAKKLLQSATEAYERSFLGIARSRVVNLDETLFELSAFQPPAFGLSASFATGQLNSGELRNQSRGVTKTSIGDAKNRLAHIAEKEQDLETATRLTKEAAQAYFEARKFYPKYPYIERGWSRLNQALLAPPPDKSVKPPPRVEQHDRAVKKLYVPMSTLPAPGESWATASALAAVVSYLGNADVEPCQMLGLLTSRVRARDFDCCDRGESRYCSIYFSDRNVELAVGRFDSLFDVSAEVTRLGSFSYLVESIERDVPTVVIFSKSALVITGYTSSGQLVFVDPTDGEEQLISYGRLELLRPRMVRFDVRRPLSDAKRAILKSGDGIIEKVLDEDFDSVAESLRILPGMLKQQYYASVNPAGRLLRRGVPRIRSGSTGFEVSVKCQFLTRNVSFVVKFDSGGTPYNLFISPEKRSPTF